MNFLLQINDMEQKIPIERMAESVDSKVENDPNLDFGIVYSVDFNVINMGNYQEVMTSIQDFFYRNSIISLKVYDSTGTRLLYETTRYTELDGEYLYLDEQGRQSLTIHVQKNVTAEEQEQQ